MTRRQKEPLRALTPDEREELERLSRSQREPAGVVAHAKALLAVGDGQSYTEAAHAAGRRSGDAVAHLVSRFNQEGLRALYARPGGHPAAIYTAAEQARILTEALRVPDREADGTATWSLTTLQRALRQGPDGLPQVSTYTIWWVLREAGWTWQRDRSWCPTGTAWRMRKRGRVRVHDRDAAPKKS
jgi:transposase